MAFVLETLKKRNYLLLTVALTVVFFALYMFFDMREGGRETSLLTTKLGTFQFYIEKFGALYFYSSVVLNFVTSLFSAVLIAFTLDHSRRGSGMFAGSTCTTAATVILGFLTFGCPGCVLPVAGTIGAVAFAKAMPLFGVEFKFLSLLIILGTFFWLIQRLKRSTHTGENIQPAGA